jgi:nitrile hydratase subunit beta
MVKETSMAAKFKPGDTVRIRVGSPPGHFRTPVYVQGKAGIVEALHGAFHNPESLARGGDGLPKQFLYLVRFDQTHLWPQYPAVHRDKLMIDIYEHWLEPA